MRIKDHSYCGFQSPNVLLSLLLSKKKGVCGFVGEGEAYTLKRHVVQACLHVVNVTCLHVVKVCFLDSYPINLVRWKNPEYSFEYCFSKIETLRAYLTWIIIFLNDFLLGIQHLRDTILVCKLKQ